MSMDKTFNAAKAEAEISSDWIKSGAFRAGANASRDETFCIMIPPPNVTGSLHMGHAFNNTLQDILVRWHRMCGFDTLWQPGTDHAGIATQMVVERQLAESQGNASRRDMGRDAFVEKIWEWKAESGGTIINQLKRLGASCDWDREAFTMSGNFPDAVLKVFVELYNKGLIYKGKRLVNWDPHFETAISDLEVENVEKPGQMWHFKYPLADGATYEYVEKDADGAITLHETRDYISIATTRPETMLGDGAVAVHPSDERYAAIVGKLCEIPVGPKEFRRQIPIITDEYPDPEFGSGAVKITGAHDFNDYGVATRNGVPLYVLMDTKAKMRSDGLPYEEAARRAQKIAEGAEAGDVSDVNLVHDDLRCLDRIEARERVIAQITEEGLAVMVPADDPRLGKRRDTGQTDADHDASGSSGEAPEPPLVPLVEQKPIMQPFGDRSKVVIEPMLTDQWFVDTAKIVSPAIEAVEDGRVQILPEQHKKVYFNWLENIEPWCISRQLWWGHQVPVWYGPELDPETGSVVGQIQFCSVDENGARAQALSYYGAGTEIAFIGGEANTLGERDGTRTISLYRDPDVLDTWFSSGLWPIGTLGWPKETEALEKYFPTDVLITGFDIIFFWVARMMMMQLEVVKEIPFHTVYVHALVRDEKGKKMSKSLGNVLDPLDLIDEYGADAVRFTLTSMAAMGRDLKLSTSRIAGYRNFGTKLWNAARFAEMNDCKPIADFDPASPTQTVNRWIVGETARIREATDTALAAYRFNDAANGLYAHVWGVVCDWYVELSKPLLQSDDPKIVAETRATMAWVIDQCLILLHPIMPFITEHLWAAIAERPKMLVHTNWPEYDAGLADPDADAEMGWTVALIEAVRSVRAELNVKPGAKIPMVLIDADATAQERYGRAADLIARLARIDAAIFADTAPEGSVTVPLDGATLCLPLAGIVDVAVERARLDKAVAKLGKEIDGLARKLSNEGFLAKAPEEVVAEQRERLSDAQAEADKIRAAADRLASIG